jgi:signal transduction histidine kinase
MLAMAVTSVLNNAIKFTPQGGQITLDVQERPGEVWLRVTDNGIGIPADQLERIFDQFYQVENHLTRREGGLGLGLAIARAVVDRQAGRIWAESSGLGKGSTFTLCMPLVA